MSPDHVQWRQECEKVIKRNELMVVIAVPASGIVVLLGAFRSFAPIRRCVAAMRT